MDVLCPECGKRSATIHYKKVVNGQKTEYHLCELCAQEKGEQMPGFDHGFSFHHLLSGLLNFEPITQMGNPQDDASHSPQVLRCPSCGLTYNQFSKMGRFGCSDCYSTFQQWLDPLMRKVHGNTKHNGKVPERAKGKIRMRHNLEKLKEQLHRKIHEEAFEEAAQIRDQIRALQKQLETE